MKAIRIHGFGGLDMLQYEDVPKPECLKDKVILEVKAVSINHLDIWVRGGLPGIPIPLPLIMGSDAAGIVSEVGVDVVGWKVGDEAVVQPGMFCGECYFCTSGKENYCPKYGILGETENGVQAEYVSLSPMNIYPKAPHLHFDDAASMPLVFMTAYQMLITRAKLQMGETVLIYGGTSGIGSAAIQIAKDQGASVIATVGSKSKINHAQKMGADHVIVHSSPDWPEEVNNIIGKIGVNVIFEHVGPVTWQKSMRLLSRGGRIVTCGATTGSTVDFDLPHLFMKQQTILGSTMSDLKSFNEVMDKINDDIFQPFVDTVLPFKNIQEAHERIENREHMGKVVLIP